MCVCVCVCVCVSVICECIFGQLALSHGMRA